MWRHSQTSWHDRAADVLAGVTVSAYLIPQVMGYASVAGLPAVAGLWAVTAALGIYALLGSSPQLSVGPESTTAMMTAPVIGPLAAGDAIRYGALCAALALVVGAVCVAAAVFRLGFLADLLSKPVLDLAVTFQDHHKAHADVLAATVRKLGATPVEPQSEYVFPVDQLKSEQDVIRFAAGLEQGATSA